jgi:dynactin 1
MNLKLQSTVSKSQAKNIDLELGTIEAREARELLGIIQVGVCLPENRAKES